MLFIAMINEKRGINMDTKLIFFDIDGTLLDEKTFTVPTSAKKALQLAKDNGHHCFINTGRTRCILDPVICSLPFDGYICGCGTYIEYLGQEIYHHHLTEENRQKIIEMAIDCHVDCVMEGKEGIYFPKTIRHTFVQTIFKRYKELHFPIYRYTKEDLFRFDKMALWYDDQSDIEKFKQFISMDFDIIQRDIDFIEIVPHTCSKATGIQKIADYLHLSIDHTISIGDSTNDLPMLTFTKKSVAMGNSNPLLFDKVSYITTDINNDGIYNALKHYKLI